MNYRAQNQTETFWHFCEMHSRILRAHQEDVQYCAKVMQAECACTNFVLCSCELSSESSLESSSVNSGRFERNFA